MISQITQTVQDNLTVIVDQSRSAHSLKQPAAQLITLFAFAASLLAMIGFFSDGYHVAFLPINHFARHLPEWSLHIITVFGDGTFLLALCLLFGLKHPKFLWAVLIAAIVGGMVSNGLKSFFDAIRPPGIFEHDTFNLIGKAYQKNSFPSGHTLTAFLMASVSASFIGRHWATGLLLALASLVGLSRIWIGVHWPIDTLVGATLGSLIGIFAVKCAHDYEHIFGLKLYLFTLSLLVTSCILLLTQKNDYSYAQPVLILTALIALWVTIRHILLKPDLGIEKKLINCIENKPEQTFYLFLTLMSIYHIAVIFQPHMALFYDEAYYYHWSLNPDFGYYSKPPMVAWAIMLSTAVLGPSILGLKIMASVFYAASAVCIFKLTQRISQPIVACFAGTIFLSTPLVGFNSEFITTDAPLIFFWSLTLYLFVRALEQEHWSHWVLLGLSTGLGMLSKYTMAPLPLALFLFLALNRDYRSKLFEYGPWLAAILAGAVFSLNIYWNIQHDWIAAKHTQEISQTQGPLLKPGSLLLFLTAQLLVFGPMWSWYTVKLCKQQKRKITLPLSKNTLSILVYATLSLLIVISIQALLSRAFANWAAPWIVSGSILLGVYLSSHFEQAPKMLIKGLLIHVVFIATFYHWPYILTTLSIEATHKNDPFHRVLGWKELGGKLRPLMQDYPNHTLASNSRDLLAYLGYYAKPASYNLARWNPNADNIRDYYDLTVNMRNWEKDSTHPFIFVSKKPLANALLDRFSTTNPLGELEVQVYENFFRKIYVYELTGFKGYE